MRVIAAIDNSAAATPVLSAAGAAAQLFHARLQAVHVEEPAAPDAARAAADAAGAKLRLVKGPIVPALVRICRQEDVVAVVLGVRSTPSGRRPAGHVAVAVATSVRKPVIVVPPDCVRPVRFRRVLIPLERDIVTASALRKTIEALCDARAEVVLLHVFEERDLPLVTDQPQHETDAWINEFVRRYCQGIDVSAVELRAGLPAEHLLTVAGEVAANAVVLGWSQQLVPGRAALVRMALEHSRVPVILIPVQRQPAADGPPGPSERFAGKGNDATQSDARRTSQPTRPPPLRAQSVTDGHPSRLEFQIAHRARKLGGRCSAEHMVAALALEGTLGILRRAIAAEVRRFGRFGLSMPQVPSPGSPS